MNSRAYAAMRRHSRNYDDPLSDVVVLETNPRSSRLGYIGVLSFSRTTRSGNVYLGVISAHDGTKQAFPCGSLDIELFLLDGTLGRRELFSRYRGLGFTDPSRLRKQLANIKRMRRRAG